MTAAEMLSHLQPLVDSILFLDVASARSGMTSCLSRMFVYAEQLGVTVPWTDDLDHFSALWSCVKVLVVELWDDEPGHSAACDAARLEILNRMMTMEEEEVCRRNAIKEVDTLVKEVESAFPSKYCVPAASIWEWMGANTWMELEGWVSLGETGGNQDYNVLQNLRRIKQRLQRDMRES